MIEKKVNTSFFIADFEELSEQEKNLIIKAKHALKTSYSSYSGFSDGASILEGSNQENVAYPSGLCAERVALFYAGSKYPNKIIKTIAVSAESKDFSIDDYISPCGACRQVMAEYEEKQKSSIRVLLYSPNNQVLISNSVEDLLPFVFKSPFLKRY